MNDSNFDPNSLEAAILRASMMHIPFDGWSEAALLAGAEDAGYGADAVRAGFPNGAIDAIALHSRLADRAMVEAFLALPERPQKVHLMIRALILLRLEISQPDKEAVRRALAVLALPVHTRISAKLLYQTVDMMWRAAGQRDTDFSFYTKRATLAAVYSATLLSWLADNSAHLDATVAFLDRRLGDVARIPKMTKPLRGFVSAGGRLVRGLAGGLFSRVPR